MRRHSSSKLLHHVLLPFVILNLSAGSSSVRYRSVSVDDAGQLHILSVDGKRVTAPKAIDQVGYGDPRISPDQRIVGWLVMYSFEPQEWRTYAGKLTVYGNGRVLHEFDSEQTIYDWQFPNGSKRVAYSSGPMHGKAAECILRDLASGKIIAHWWVKDGDAPPTWAVSLRR